MAGATMRGPHEALEMVPVAAPEESTVFFRGPATTRVAEPETAPEESIRWPRLLLNKVRGGLLNSAKHVLGSSGIQKIN